MTNPTQNAIEVAHLTKQFRLLHQGRSLKNAVVQGLARKSYVEQFTALNDVTFEVPHGQTVAVIGRNGSGKSTLLGTLARVYKPTGGSVGLYAPDGGTARVAPLLALGAGFHVDLTGLDNIRFYGAILGLTPQEVRAKRDAIIAFAELENKIDTTLHGWNDGAKLRLGFAIAVHTDPDILLVDEVLAVGDEAFQNKCYRLIGQMQADGKTILFVSHDLAAVERVADRVLWLDNGAVRQDGATAAVLNAYHAAASDSSRE